MKLDYIASAFVFDCEYRSSKGEIINDEAIKTLFAMKAHFMPAEVARIADLEIRHVIDFIFANHQALVFDLHQTGTLHGGIFEKDRRFIGHNIFAIINLALSCGYKDILEYILKVNEDYERVGAGIESADIYALDDGREMSSIREMWMGQMLWAGSPDKVVYDIFRVFFIANQDVNDFFYKFSSTMINVKDFEEEGPSRHQRFGHSSLLLSFMMMAKEPLWKKIDDYTKKKILADFLYKGKLDSFIDCFFYNQHDFIQKMEDRLSVHIIRSIVMEWLEEVIEKDLWVQTYFENNSLFSLAGMICYGRDEDLVYEAVSCYGIRNILEREASYTQTTKVLDKIPSHLQFDDYDYKKILSVLNELF